MTTTNTSRPYADDAWWADESPSTHHGSVADVQITDEQATAEQARRVTTRPAGFVPARPQQGRHRAHP